LIADSINGLDGEGGLASTGIPNGGKSWIEVTLEGPAYLEFYHKSLGEFSWSSPLQLSLDDKFVDLEWLNYYTDEPDWFRGVVEIPVGEHKVRWVVENNFMSTDNVIIDLVEFSLVEEGEPEIYLEPEAREPEAPGFAFFEVEARAYPFPTYQWFRDGEPLEGEIARVLWLDNLWEDDSGEITVVVSNELGEVESQLADLTLQRFAITKPLVGRERVGSGLDFKKSKPRCFSLSGFWLQINFRLSFFNQAELNQVNDDIICAHEIILNHPPDLVFTLGNLDHTTKPIRFICGIIQPLQINKFVIQGKLQW
jgi:hypothetical protein